MNNCTIRLISVIYNGRMEAVLNKSSPAIATFIVIKKENTRYVKDNGRYLFEESLDSCTRDS